MSSLKEMLMAKVAFDEKVARRRWTHTGPDNFLQMTNADIAEWAAQAENARLKPVLDALGDCVEALETVANETVMVQTRVPTSLQDAQAGPAAYSRAPTPNARMATKILAKLRAAIGGEG